MYSRVAPHGRSNRGAKTCSTVHHEANNLALWYELRDLLQEAQQDLHKLNHLYAVSLQEKEVENIEGVTEEETEQVRDVAGFEENDVSIEPDHSNAIFEHLHESNQGEMSLDLPLAASVEEGIPLEIELQKSESESCFSQISVKEPYEFEEAILAAPSYACMEDAKELNELVVVHHNSHLDREDEVAKPHKVVAERYVPPNYLDSCLLDHEYHVGMNEKFFEENFCIVVEINNFGEKWFPLEIYNAWLHIYLQDIGWNEIGSYFGVDLKLSKEDSALVVEHEKLGITSFFLDNYDLVEPSFENEKLMRSNPLLINHESMNVNSFCIMPRSMTWDFVDTSIIVHSLHALVDFYEIIASLFDMNWIGAFVGNLCAQNFYWWLKGMQHHILIEGVKLNEILSYGRNSFTVIKSGTCMFGIFLFFSHVFGMLHESMFLLQASFKMWLIAWKHWEIVNMDPHGTNYFTVGEKKHTNEIVTGLEHIATYGWKSLIEPKHINNGIMTELPTDGRRGIGRTNKDLDLRTNPYQPREDDMPREPLPKTVPHGKITRSRAEAFPNEFAHFVGFDGPTNFNVHKSLDHDMYYVIIFFKLKHKWRSKSSLKDETSYFGGLKPRPEAHEEGSMFP